MPLPPFDWTRLLRIWRRDRKGSKPAPKKRHLSLERLEARELFSANAELPQGLNPLGGAAQYNVIDPVFQPTGAELQPKIDLHSGGISSSGSFSFLDTGSYSLALSQSGNTGSDFYFFDLSGTVSFTLDVSGTRGPGGYQYSASLLTQSVSVDWSYRVEDAGHNVLLSQGDDDSFTVGTSSGIDPFFWAGYSWYAPTAWVVNTYSLPLFGLSATSLSLDAVGGESFTLAITGGAVTVTGTGSLALADLREETGQSVYGITSVQSYSSVQTGNNSFTLSERGTYGSGYSLGSVAYSEQGTATRQFTASGIQTEYGTVNSAGVQSFGDAAHNLDGLRTSSYLSTRLTVSTYFEGTTDSYALTQLGSYGGGSFALTSFSYDGGGTGSSAFTLDGSELSTGSFTANDTVHAQDPHGFAGTLTNDSRGRETGNFTSTLDFSRAESAAGTYVRSQQGSYAQGTYSFSNFSLSRSASGTYTSWQGGTYTDHATGTRVSGGSGVDSFSEANGSISSSSSADSQAFTTTVTYSRDRTSAESYSAAGGHSYSLSQVGSAANGSYSLSSYALQQSQSGTFTRGSSAFADESGTVLRRTTGSGNEASSDSSGGSSGSGLSNHSLSSTGTSVYSSSTEMPPFFGPGGVGVPVTPTVPPVEA